MTREERLDWLCRLRSKVPVYMPCEWIKSMNEALTDTIKELEQESNWIPCSERLPERVKNKKDSKWVLVTLSNGVITDGFYNFVDNKWHYSSFYSNNNVVAWMPLPEPYKESE